MKSKQVLNCLRHTSLSCLFLPLTDLLWTAPELLSDSDAAMTSHQCGTVAQVIVSGSASADCGPLTSPLSCPPCVLVATQKADSYAFGVCLYEIIGRRGPFGNVSLSPEG